MVVRRGQARRLADCAVDVSDVSAGPAHDVVVIVTDSPLEPCRAAGWFDAAHESGRSEGMECLIYGLKRDVSDATAYQGGDRLDVRVVTVAERIEQCDAGSRYP